MKSLHLRMPAGNCFAVGNSWNCSWITSASMGNSKMTLPSFDGVAAKSPVARLHRDQLVWMPCGACWMISSMFKPDLPSVIIV